MITNERILELLKEVEPEVIKCKTIIHENPELSLKEEKTSALILEEVKALGLEYERVGDYGIIAILRGASEGKTVMVRADMDALPVDESTDNLIGAKKSVSKNKGVSHACGHDAHVAMVIGAMKVLSKLRDEINGTVLFVFEQAEEIGAGIMPMMKALAKYNVSYSYGTHVYSGLESGKISVQAGPRMAAITSFNIRVVGKGGHVSRPDLTINPLMCAANIVGTINGIWTGEIDPTKTVTVAVSTLHCGEKNNVIADEAIFGGSLRYYDVTEGKKAFEGIKRVCEGVAAAHRCKIEYDRIFEAPYVVINDQYCSNVAEKSILDLFGEESIGECEPWFATESMALYLNKYPGVLAFLGIDDKEKGFGAGHHTREFDMNNNVLIKGTGASIKYVVNLLNNYI